MSVCADIFKYLLGLSLHLVQCWQVRKVFFQRLYTLLFLLVLLTFSLTFLLQTTDVAISRFYLGTNKKNTSHDQYADFILGSCWVH